MKPKPVVTQTICSECGLDWDRHGEASLQECVRLLKYELSTRPKPTTWWNGYQGVTLTTPTITTGNTW